MDILKNIEACFVIIGMTGDIFTTQTVVNRKLGHEANWLPALAMRLLGSKWMIVRCLMALWSIYSAYHLSGAILLYAHGYIPHILLGFNILLMAYAIWNNSKIAKLI